MRPGGGQQNFFVGSRGRSDQRNPTPSGNAHENRNMTSSLGYFSSSTQATSNSASSSGPHSSQEWRSGLSSNVLSTTNGHMLSALGRGTQRDSSSRVQKQIVIELRMNLDGETISLTSPNPPTEMISYNSLDLENLRQEPFMRSVFRN